MAEGGTRTAGSADLIGLSYEKITGADPWDLVDAALLANRDLNGDGIRDLALGMPWAVSANEGAVAVFYGPVVGRMGWSIAAPDVDGDGADDVWVGAPWATVDGNAKGGLGLLFYADTLAAWKGDGVCHDDTEADVTVTGEAALDFAGWSMADAGDLNQDGEDDLLLGAYGSDVSGAGAGAAYLVLSAHLVP